MFQFCHATYDAWRLGRRYNVWPYVLFFPGVLFSLSFLVGAVPATTAALDIVTGLFDGLGDVAMMSARVGPQVHHGLVGGYAAELSSLRSTGLLSASPGLELLPSEKVED